MVSFILSCRFSFPFYPCYLWNRGRLSDLHVFWSKASLELFLKPPGIQFLTIILPEGVWSRFLLIKKFTCWLMPLPLPWSRLSYWLVLRMPTNTAWKKRLPTAQKVFFYGDPGFFHCISHPKFKNLFIIFFISILNPIEETLKFLKKRTRMISFCSSQLPTLSEGPPSTWRSLAGIRRKIGAPASPTLGCCYFDFLSSLCKN